jgi:peroxiredoxin
MLKTGKIAPDFTLPLFDSGNSHLYSSSKTSVVAFYKFNCPICQFTFPFLQKIFERLQAAFSFVAIAQDAADKVISFRDTYGITIPTAMDLPPYPVSNAYRIEIVPSLFVINEDHWIEIAFESFDKKQIQKTADLLAKKSGQKSFDVFEGAAVPELRPGWNSRNAWEFLRWTAVCSAGILLAEMPMTNIEQMNFEVWS